MLAELFVESERTEVDRRAGGGSDLPSEGGSRISTRRP